MLEAAGQGGNDPPSSGLVDVGRGRTARGEPTVGLAGAGVRLVALDMNAFNTCAKLGLMPQARHGGRGVWMFAVVGSKLDGTGLEKLQMVHTQVAEAAAGSGGGRYGLSARAGEPAPGRGDEMADALV